MTGLMDVQMQLLCGNVSALNSTAKDILDRVAVTTDNPPYENGGWNPLHPNQLVHPQTK